MKDDWFSELCDILDTGAEQRRIEREQWNADHKPISESTSEQDETIGVFLIEGRIFYAYKKKNGYHQEQLIEVPGPVIEAIYQVFKGIQQ